MSLKNLSPKQPKRQKTGPIHSDRSLPVLFNELTERYQGISEVATDMVRG